MLLLRLLSAPRPPNWLVSMREISAADAILEATIDMMDFDKSIIVIGEGVPDPKACFGTTRGLRDKFPDRVFDMPISENGGTGICIGASLNGLKPIMVHMRQDFLMYAMDQIVNNAAKWWQMFGGQKSVPIVIRAFTGRGWGQGIQHSQNLEAMFAHVPGLKVVTPSNAKNAAGLLMSAIQDPNPVIILEHRWVHSLTSEVGEHLVATPIGKARVARLGSDITICSWSYTVTECLKAAEFLQEQGISAEVIDMQTLRPMDIPTLVESCKKTKRLIVANDAWTFGSLAGTVMTQVSLHCNPQMYMLTNPNYATPPAPNLTKDYYVTALDVFNAAADLLYKQLDNSHMIAWQNAVIHDVPNPDFKGPF